MADEMMISKLHEQLAEVKAESIRRKDKIRELMAKVDAAEKAKAAAEAKVAELESDLETIAAGYEELEAQAQAPPDEKTAALIAELDTLKGEIRTTKHKSKFAELAEKAGIRKEAIDDVWTLSGYKPEGDDIDEKQIGEVIGGVLKDKPYFAGAGSGQPAPDGGQARPNLAAMPPGPGSRGATPTTNPWNPVPGIVDTASAALAKRGGNPFRIG